MLLSKLLHAYRKWRAYRKNLEELSALDDRTLADIGITRADIPAVAAGAIRG